MSNSLKSHTFSFVLWFVEAHPLETHMTKTTLTLADCQDRTNTKFDGTCIFMDIFPIRTISFTFENYSIHRYQFSYDLPFFGRLQNLKAIFQAFLIYLDSTRIAAIVFVFMFSILASRLSVRRIETKDLWIFWICMHQAIACNGRIHSPSSLVMVGTIILLKSHTIQFSRSHSTHSVEDRTNL